MSYYLTEKIKREVGKNLQRAREKKGLKQVEVAVDAGINPSYYSKIERGEVNPSIDKLYKVLRALGLRSVDILPF